MNLQELLKKYLEEEKITTLMEEMKSNKIFTASEENLDTRYNKLKGDYDALSAKSNEDVELIKQLKETSKGNEEMQNKFTEYESKVAQLQAENEQLKIDNAVKVELLGAKAKGEDLDYLMFKIKQDNAELTLDENGKLKGLDVETIKTSYPNNFEVESKKVVDVNKLPKIELNDNNITKEQFEKMGYSSRVKLKEENPEMYNTLAKK